MMLFLVSLYHVSSMLHFTTYVKFEGLRNGLQTSTPLQTMHVKLMKVLRWSSRQDLVKEQLNYLRLEASRNKETLEKLLKIQKVNPFSQKLQVIQMFIKTRYWCFLQSFTSSETNFWFIVWSGSLNWQYFKS